MLVYSPFPGKSPAKVVIDYSASNGKRNCKILHFGRLLGNHLSKSNAAQYSVAAHAPLDRYTGRYSAERSQHISAGARNTFRHNVFRPLW